MNTKSRRGIEEPPVIRRILIGIAVTFVGVFLLLPLANVFAQALAKGWSAYVNALREADTRSAVLLTLLVSAICVPLNLVFGVVAAWAVATVGKWGCKAWRRCCKGGVEGLVGSKLFPK